MKHKEIIKYVGMKYEDTYTGLGYALGFSNSAGLGNALRNLDKDINEMFGQGCLNHFKMSVIISQIYPIAIDKLSNTKHSRIYSNLFHTGISLSFLAWHYFSGTESPLESMILPYTAGVIMVNKQVSNLK